MSGQHSKMGHTYKYCNVEHHLALVLMLLLHMDASTVEVPTYKHEDHLIKKEYIKKECTPTNNRVCQCKDGYFWQADFCIKHKECPSGYGVWQNGTLHSDTKCERCARGVFSAVMSSTSPCVEHTNCTSMDLKVVLRGTSRHDNICSTCENLQNDGGLSILKHFLPDFFAHKKIHRSKLYRFVRHHLGQNLQGKHSLYSKKSLLLHRFSEWIRGASIEQMRKLPMQLRESNIHNTADKLSKIFKELDASKCDCKIATNCK